MNQANYRRRISSRVAEANETCCNHLSREELEAQHGKVWDADELEREFLGCVHVPPLALVVRRDDCSCGSLSFQIEPRFYFDFVLFPSE